MSGPVKGQKYVLGEAPCKSCQVMTRSKHMKRSDHPNTVTRQGRGMCSPCYNAVLVVERAQLTELKFPIQQCTADGCDAMTRSPKDNPELAPGTRRRVSYGKCSECYYKGKNQEVRVSAKQVEVARTELDAFLAARRRRTEAARRRQAAPMGFRRAAA